LGFNRATGRLSLEPLVDKRILQDLLDDLRQSYPDLTIFHLVKIDHLASSGKVELASELAANLCSMPANDVLKHASDIVKELRQ
jgi:hypothetical protein